MYLFLTYGIPKLFDLSWQTKTYQNAAITFIYRSFCNCCLFLGVFAVCLVTSMGESSLLFPLIIKGMLLSELSNI